MTAHQTPRHYLGLPAPAKLNLFLHVLGRREDGYHEIESVFVPVDLCDTLDLVARRDGDIVREGDLTGPPHADLAVRAAQALLAHARALGLPPPPGVTLRVEKRIPVGAGMGGGSSDAATALLGLNRLWNLRLSRATLARLARGLGADVPFFLGCGPAFVQGVGERCAPLALAPRSYVVVYPQVHVSTAEIFADPKLTRDTKPTTIAGFSAALQLGAAPGEAVLAGFGANDLQDVVRRRFAPVDQALRLLDQLGPARMSGSGSAVFVAAADATQARQWLQGLRASLPQGWSAWALSSMAALPLADW